MISKLVYLSWDGVNVRAADKKILEIFLEV
jgi:hypothetical protein